MIRKLVMLASLLDLAAQYNVNISNIIFCIQLLAKDCTQDMEEYKYTCEPGHQEWTPLNSNLCMQSIKVPVVVPVLVVTVCTSCKYAMIIAVFDFI